MTDLDRKILAKACGLREGHIYRLLDNGITVECRQCGDTRDRDLIDEASQCLIPTFTTPDDWELVRVRVVLPNLNDFEGDFNLLSLYGWLLKSPEECCQDAAGFIKSRHDLFPWVAEIAEIAEKSCPPEKTQIIKGT